jgi:phosphatidylserine decarboxylase
MSFVGALNVGSIKLDFDSQVATNTTMPKEPYMYDKAYVKD